MCDLLESPVGAYSWILKEISIYGGYLVCLAELYGYITVIFVYSKYLLIFFNRSLQSEDMDILTETDNGAILRNLPWFLGEYVSMRGHLL